jgi:hypothetical protein
MEKASACSVCGEKTHFAAKCTALNLPPLDSNPKSGGVNPSELEEDDSILFELSFALPSFVLAN